MLRWRQLAADRSKVKSRRGTASQTRPPTADLVPPPDDGYRSLAVSDVLADLPSLDREQLLLVKALEEAGERRPVILDRIADLLVVTEGARRLTVVDPPTTPEDGGAAAAHPAGGQTNGVEPAENHNGDRPKLSLLRGDDTASRPATVPVAPTPPPAAPTPPSPQTPTRTNPAPKARTGPAPTAPTPKARTLKAPTPPVKTPVGGGEPPAASDLVDQMGELLAKGAVRRAGAVAPSSAAAAPPPPIPAEAIPAPTGGKGKRSGRQTTGTPVANGLIVPTDGRRSKGRRRPRLRAALLVAVLLAGGGAGYWKISHKASAPTTAPARPAHDLVADLLVKTVPAGYVPQADTTGANGPVGQGKAVERDGRADAAAFFGQAGFLHGYQRSWTTPDQRDLVVVIYHFRTAEGAAAYAARSIATATATGKPPPAAFAVAGVPAATGLTATVATNQLASVTFSRGRYAVSVSSRGPAATSQAATATQVATAQFALLPVG